MLILARKVEQRIQIGRDVTITVLKIRNGTVKVGIEAPKGTPVFRTEVLARRAAAQETANFDPGEGAAAAGAPHDAQGEASPAAALSSVTACEEDGERPMPARGAMAKVGPGPALARRPGAQPLRASYRGTRNAALPPVTAVG